MASSSSTWTYRVFTSFHGEDVRKTLLTHLRKQFNSNGISMFDDQTMERSQTIASSLTRAIRESRISLVVLTKNYASSRWCLDELVEILRCKQDIGQIVMTIFYQVDPSDVRKQSGDFGKVFNKTCARRTKEERRKWSQALTDVGNIAGEHFLNWDNESKMIEEIARDISNKLNTTISKDFEDMVGIESHLQKMQSLLRLDDENGAMIVGICGPAGIGKTTIARALHSRLSSCFQITCFMENLRGSYNCNMDEYGLKLCLQEKLLSKILNHNDMRVNHLGAVPERLCDQKVLIILDDVDDLKQLEALANETNWFGPGSRIIVTTEDHEILEQHDISITYHVNFPTKEEAYKMFCRYALRRQSSAAPPNGFEKLADRVRKLCSNLPLGLRVMGSSLCRKKEDDWEGILHRLENSPGRDIERVLRVGYENLHEDDQSLFLHIALFFNYEYYDHVLAMLGESNLDVVRLGMKSLVYKSLIQISTEGKVVMHKLLQHVGRQANQRQEPWKRYILTDANEISSALETESDNNNSVIMGISFDVSRIPDSVSISPGAFRRMRNLRFLNIYKTKFDDTNDKVHVPKDMDFPPRLRLLHWEVYPGKSLPCTFRPEYLVELNLKNNELEKLWEGTQPLRNLKRVVLSESKYMKELPDLSNATNVKSLELAGCSSLEEIPSSIGNLEKLELLQMTFCSKLKVVPTLSNLASLKTVYMMGCSQLRNIPEISGNITRLVIQDTMLEQVPVSTRLWCSLHSLNIYGSVNTFPPTLASESFLKPSDADIEKLPDFIKDLPELQVLHIAGCPKLASLSELPGSLIRLIVDTCESLETISLPFGSQISCVCFPSCLNLGQEARRGLITQLPHIALLPGRDIPAQFHLRTLGSSLTIRSAFPRIRTCVVISPKVGMKGDHFQLLCRVHINGGPIDVNMSLPFFKIGTEHLLTSSFVLSDEWLEQDNEILIEFSTNSEKIDVIECGLEILTDEQAAMEAVIPNQMSEDDNENIPDGSHKSCSEQVCVDEDQSLAAGTNKCDVPRVKILMGYGMYRSLILIFLLSLISSVLLYNFLRKH